VRVFLLFFKHAFFCGLLIYYVYYRGCNFICPISFFIYADRALCRACTLGRTLINLFYILIFLN